MIAYDLLLGITYAVYFISSLLAFFNVTINGYS